MTPLLRMQITRQLLNSTRNIPHFPIFGRRLAIAASPISVKGAILTRTMATVQEYRLKVDNEELKNGQKKEAEVEGIEGAKVVLLKVNNQLRALGPKCTRRFTTSVSSFTRLTEFRLWRSINQRRYSRRWPYNLSLAWCLLQYVYRRYRKCSSSRPPCLIPCFCQERLSIYHRY
jgi:hypothetical protein